MERTEQTFTIGHGVAAVSATDMGAELAGPHVEIPGDLRMDVDALVQDVKSKLSARVKSNLDQGMSAAQAQPMAGGPITVGYEYLDLLALSPQQFLVPGAVYRPHRLVAAGEFALLLAVLFINPTPTPGGGPSATMHLGGRPYRIRFEQIDLTNLTNGPDFTFTGIFPSPAPLISVWPVGIVPPDPGQNPRLVELNVTMDVPLALQPYAAFATQWIDIEDDPGFPFPQPGGLRNQTPLRYLVYPVS